MRKLILVLTAITPKSMMQSEKAENRAGGITGFRLFPYQHTLHSQAGIRMIWSFEGFRIPLSQLA
jgi:hypothetical protein